MPNQNIKCDKKLNRLHEEHRNNQKTNAKTSWHNANKQRFVNLHIISGSAISVKRIITVFMEETETSSSKSGSKNHQPIRFYDNIPPIKQHSCRRSTSFQINTRTTHHNQHHPSPYAKPIKSECQTETRPDSDWSPFCECDPCQDRTDSAWAHY